MSNKTTQYFLIFIVSILYNSCGLQNKKQKKKLVKPSYFQADGLNLDCGSDDQINGICKNKELPPEPSILRNLYKSGVNDSQGSRLTNETYGFSEVKYLDYDQDANQNLNGKNKILPYSRMSVDGRVLLSISPINLYKPNYTKVPKSNVLGPIFTYFDPEHIGYDITINGKNPIVSGAVIHPIVFNTFHPNFSDIPEEDYLAGSPKYHSNYYPGTFNHEICNESQLPRACSAYREGPNSQVVLGECYDISLWTRFNIGIGNETRMVPLTLFVEKAKKTGNEEKIVIFPRQKNGILPSLEYFKNLKYINTNPSNVWELNYGSDVSHIKILTDDCLVNGTIPQQSQWGNYPLYCKFVYSQTKLETMNIDGVNKQAPNIGPLFEPNFSGDGKLLIVNQGNKGLYYSYSNNACDLSGFNKLKKLSYMPFDPNIYNNYPIGKAQRKNGVSKAFRDNLGKNYNPGDIIRGSYMWIDREARNIFYTSISNVQDQIKDIHGNRIDIATGKGVQVLGAWTNGKAVALDGSLSMFDFGGHPSSDSSANNKYVKQMHLYKNKITSLRPTTSKFMGSLENQMNMYDAMTPLMPFDVVWRVSNNMERNSEIVFDEYMMDNALIVAHSNAPIEHGYKNGETERYTYFKNGWIPQNPDQVSVNPESNPDYQYKEYPLVQNAATSKYTKAGGKVPNSLTLMGGARIESIAQGGVYGKGIYLDGYNDYIYFEPQVNHQSDYIITLWLDSHSLSSGLRTLYHFPDGSEIQIGNYEIKARAKQKISSSIQYFSQSMPINNIGLEAGKYFHLTIKLQNIQNPGTNGLNWDKRRLYFYINGTPVFDSMIEANSVYKRKYLEFEEVTQCSNANCNSFLPFSLKFGSGVFALGHPYDENKGFKGWIDEFKIFQFTSDQNQGNDSVSSSIDSFYDEFICNQAFGSLVEVNRFDSETNFSEISNLKKLAVKYGILDTDPKLYKKGGAQVIPPAQIGAFLRTAAQNKANICEQLILESYQTANDLPNQRNRGLICANKVHKNNSHTYAHRCQRKKVLGIAKKDLTAGQPRPDFSDVPFCLSCHNDEQSLESLKVSALEIEPIDREFDSRRQPLDIPRTIKGCIPEQAPFNQIGSSCSNNIFYLDNIFDFNPKVIP